MMVGPDTCWTVPFFTSVTVTGCRVVFVVTDGRALHPGLQVVNGQLLPVDGEPEVLRYGQLLGTFGQLDDQIVSLNGDDLERSSSPSSSGPT